MPVSQVRTAQRCTLEACETQITSAQISPIEQCLAQVCPLQACSLEICIAKVRMRQVNVAELAGPALAAFQKLNQVLFISGDGGSGDPQASCN